MHCVDKQILQRKTEFIWCAIKIRTLCAVNVDRNPVSDRNSSQSARKPNFSFYSIVQYRYYTPVHCGIRQLNTKFIFKPECSRKPNFLVAFSILPHDAAVSRLFIASHECPLRLRCTHVS